LLISRRFAAAAASRRQRPPFSFCVTFSLSLTFSLFSLLIF